MSEVENLEICSSAYENLVNDKNGISNHWTGWTFLQEMLGNQLATWKKIKLV